LSNDGNRGGLGAQFPHGSKMDRLIGARHQSSRRKGARMVKGGFARIQEVSKKKGSSSEDYKERGPLSGKQRGDKKIGRKGHLRVGSAHNRRLKTPGGKVRGNKTGKKKVPLMKLMNGRREDCAWVTDLHD